MSVYVGYYAHLQNKLKLNLVQRAANVPRDLDSIAVSLFTNRETAMLSTLTTLTTRITLITLTLTLTPILTLTMTDQRSK